MKQVGVGIIGCGGRARGVAQLVQRIAPDVKVVALHDPAPASTALAQEKLNPAARVYDDYHDLVAAPDVDWVMVASWNCFHREHTVAAFEAGKDVFCEKPLATTLADCVAMREAWQASGRKFVIGFTLRYAPLYRKLKELIQAGAIGRVVSMEFNETLHFCHGGYIMGDWRRLVQNAGSHLLEKCCHDLDIVNWLLDSIATRVASFGGLNFFTPDNAHHVERLGKDKEGHPAYRTWPGTVQLDPFASDKDILDNQVAIIEYANHVRAAFHSNCNAGIHERRMYICGTEGAVRADLVKGAIELQKIGFDTPRENVDSGARDGHGGGDTILAQSLADCMLKGAESLTTLEDGLKAAVTAFGIDRAAETGHVVDMRPLWAEAGVPFPEA